MLSDEFEKVVDEILEEIKAEEAAQAKQELEDEAKRKAFHISFMRVITPVVINSKWR
jgi:hypothetical protein